MLNNNNNNNNNNSVQFKVYLLTCRLNSTRTYNKASTKTNKTLEQHQCTKNRTLSKQNKKLWWEKKNIKSTRAKALNPNEIINKLI